MAVRLTVKLQKAILQDAELRYPQESCGLLVAVEGGTRYYPCDNVHEKPTESFRIAPEQYAEMEDLGEIVGVAHSHPDATSQPSIVDIACCNKSGLPWFIVSWPQVDEIRTIRPGKVPLLGREFVHGTQDCLSLVLDYYRREKGIELGDYQRDDNWWNNGQNLYLDNLPKAGFEKVQDLRDGDLVLMQIRSPVPNHAGIYLESGELRSEELPHVVPGVILHHLHGRLSSRDVYASGMFEETTVSVWRYKDA